MNTIHKQVSVTAPFCTADVDVELAELLELVRTAERTTTKSCHGSIYTALDTICTAERLNLEPITTPKSSPQSNGMSEAFVNTLKRDYVSGADRRDAATLLDQAPAWITDYNAIAPYSSLGYRSPQQHRTEVLAVV